MGALASRDFKKENTKASWIRLLYFPDTAKIRFISLIIVYSSFRTRVGGNAPGGAAFRRLP